MMLPALVLCVGLQLAPAPARRPPSPVVDTTPRAAGKRPPRDAWFGEDKVKHAVLSFIATSAAASGARIAGLDRRPSLWVGAAAGAGLGLWKEWRDRSTPGATPSARDLVWDGVGIAAGTMIGEWSR